MELEPEVLSSKARIGTRSSPQQLKPVDTGLNTNSNRDPFRSANVCLLIHSMRNLYGSAIDYTTSKVKGDHPFNY
jgi:hypothetical protein